MDSAGRGTSTEHTCHAAAVLSVPRRTFLDVGWLACQGYLRHHCVLYCVPIPGVTLTLGGVADVARSHGAGLRGSSRFGVRPLLLLLAPPSWAYNIKKIWGSVLPAAEVLFFSRSSARRSMTFPGRTIDDGGVMIAVGRRRMSRSQPCRADRPLHQGCV